MANRTQNFSRPVSALAVFGGRVVIGTAVIAYAALTTMVVTAISTDFDGAIRVRLGVDGGELHIEGGESE